MKLLLNLWWFLAGILAIANVLGVLQVAPSKWISYFDFEVAIGLSLLACVIVVRRFISARYVAMLFDASEAITAKVSMQQRWNVLVKEVLGALFALILVIFYGFFVPKAQPFLLLYGVYFLAQLSYLYLRFTRVPAGVLVSDDSILVAINEPNLAGSKTIRELSIRHDELQISTHKTLTIPMKAFSHDQIKRVVRKLIAIAETNNAFVAQGVKELSR